MHTLFISDVLEAVWTWRVDYHASTPASHLHMNKLPTHSKSNFWQYIFSMMIYLANTFLNDIYIRFDFITNPKSFSKWIVGERLTEPCQPTWESVCECLDQLWFAGLKELKAFSVSETSEQRKSKVFKDQILSLLLEFNFQEISLCEWIVPMTIYSWLCGEDYLYIGLYILMKGIEICLATN